VLHDLAVNAVCSNFIARMPVRVGFDPRFVCYVHATLHTGGLNTRAIKQTTGIQNLDADRYLAEAAAFPGAREQCAIADFLDRETGKIDALVARKERQVELLQEKRAALITHAVTKGLDPTVPMKDSGIVWLGAIPAHWGVVHLRRVVARFVDYRGKTPRKVGAGVALVTARNLSNGRIDMGLSQEYIPEEDYGPWMVRGLPEIGDVLVTTEAPLGQVAQVIDAGVALAQRLILLKCDRARMTNDYLRYYIASGAGQSELYSYATGSTAVGIKASHLKETRVVTPPVSEQRSIAAYLDHGTARLDALIGKVREGIELLRQYRTALISAAVTGKIDVRDEAATAP
jgi:type I restriction enzyme S subunit